MIASRTGNIQDESRREIVQWLTEIWPDRRFTIPRDGLPAWSGAYTQASFLIERDHQTYFLKKYNPAHIDGVITEEKNYSYFGRHSILPHPVYYLSSRNRPVGVPPLGLLIPYYQDHLRPESVSLLEILAAGLNLATIFAYFAKASRIYFDLKLDSLRLDTNGSLKLIDFTDLITSEELWRDRAEGLPVVDRTSFSIPPEGVKYQTAVDLFRDDKNQEFAPAISAARSLKADPYMTFSLGSLMLELLGGESTDDPIVRRRLASSAADGEGAFSADDQRVLIGLIHGMRKAEANSRSSLQEARAQLWKLLKPRVIARSAVDANRRTRACRLLHTLTKDEADPLSKEILELINLREVPHK